MTEDRQSLYVRVSGRVQGVNFRVWACTEARRLGLAGWVRNEDDGSVTALIVGSDTAVAMMLERLWHGPAAAAVTSVEADVAPLAAVPLDFHIAD